MCYAAIPYIIEAAVVVAGTAYSVDQAHKSAEYNEQIALNQAKLDNTKAQQANAMGSYAADQARIRGQLMRGQQIAAFAANNVDVSTGTAADILGDTAMFTAADERQARINAAQQAYGFQVDSLSEQGAAKYAKWQGNVQANTAILQGASSLASMYGNKASFTGGGGAPASLTGSTLLTGGNTVFGYGVGQGNH